MKSIFLLILSITYLHPSLWAQSQKEMEKYEKEIYSQVLDTLNTMIEFGFYEPHLLHIDTKEYALRPMDTFNVVDPITYEEITKTGLELKIEGDSSNLREAKLFKFRNLYPNGLFLIGKIRNNQVHRNVDLQKYISLSEYPDLSKIKSFKDKYIVKNKLGKYDAFLSDEKYESQFKYALKAMIFFSGIQWDNTLKFAVVECGFHYQYKNMGKSGGGFLAIVEKTDNQVRIAKFIGLWEE